MSVGLPTPRPLRRRRWPWLLMVAALPAAGWFARFAYLRITLHPTPRPEYWAERLRALDPPPEGAIRSAAVEALLADRPWETLPALAGISAGRPYEALKGEWNAQRPSVRAAKAAFQSQEFDQAYAKFRAALLRGWQAPIQSNPARLNWTWLNNKHFWAQWLAVRSRWNIEARGKVADASEDWLAILRIGRESRRAQSAMAWLWETSGISMVAKEIIFQRSAAAPVLDTAAFAAAVDEALGGPFHARLMADAIRIGLRNMLEHVCVRDGGDWMDLSATVGVHRSMWGVGGSPGRYWNLLTPFFHSGTETLRRIDAACDLLADADTLVAVAALADSAEFRAASLTALDGVLDGQTYSLSRGLHLCQQARCQMDAALAMLALERYRVEQGRYPTSLDALVPRYLPRLPIDYADRKPLRYRRTGGWSLNDRYLLYSVGMNGIDESGNEGRYLTPDGQFEHDRPDVNFSAIARPPGDA